MNSVWSDSCCCNFKMMEKITFMEFWQLLRPSETFDTRARFESCLAKWNRWDEAKRTRIAQQIAAKKKNDEFVHPNPYFAMDDAAQQDELRQARSKPRSQTLSFNDYYAKYGTTEERDGWKMANPTGEKVIYVKS